MTSYGCHDDSMTSITKIQIWDIGHTNMGCRSKFNLGHTNMVYRLDKYRKRSQPFWK